MKTLKIYQVENLDKQSPLHINCSIEDFKEYQDLKRLVIKHLKNPLYNQSQIQICLIGLYKSLPKMITPICFQQNLDYFINLTEDTQEINLLVLNCEDAQAQIKKSENNTVQFDSDGEYDKDQGRDIIPNGGRYYGNNIVKCAFCCKNSSDKKSIKNLGPFYGPYLQQKFIHLVCALWCNNIFIDEQKNNGRLTNVQASLNQSSLRAKCRQCNQKGAGLKCHSDKCTYRIHYECGLGLIKFDWQHYTFLCPKCEKKKQQQQEFEQFLLNEESQQRKKMDIQG